MTRIYEVLRIRGAENWKRSILFIVVVSLLVIGIVSCSISDSEDKMSSPTAPGNVENLADFSAGGPGGDFDDPGILGMWKTTVTVRAGEYLYQYTTTLGTFYLAFRAIQDTTIHIGLQPEDWVMLGSLYTGTIQAGATALYTDSWVEVFAWPAAPTVFWNTVITVPQTVVPAPGSSCTGDNISFTINADSSSIHNLLARYSYASSACSGEATAAFSSIPIIGDSFAAVSFDPGSSNFHAPMITFSDPHNATIEFFWARGAPECLTTTSGTRTYSASCQ